MESLWGEAGFISGLAEAAALDLGMIGNSDIAARKYLSGCLVGEIWELGLKGSALAAWVAAALRAVVDGCVGWAPARSAMPAGLPRTAEAVVPSATSAAAVVVSQALRMTGSLLISDAAPASLPAGWS
jgi:hypothetical protein